MRLTFNHPSRDALRDWLTGSGDAKTDAHLATCSRCALVLEGLEAPDSGIEGIAVALAEVLSPPSDLSDRLEQRVTAKLESRELVDLIADMFGAGLETTKLLLSTEMDEGEDE